MKENILLNLSVNQKYGRTGDWKAAVDEAFELSKQLNIGCILIYANQYSITLIPNMTQEEIDEIKSQKFIIGV